MEKILVTGGAGFIGSNFCNFNKNNYQITALDNLFLGKQTNLDSEINFIKGDAGNWQDLEQVGAVDYVLHLAGTSSAPMFLDDGFVDGYVNSVQSFVTVLDWARKNKVKKVLYASTSSLYGNNPVPLLETQQVTPINHYSVTKMMYEQCASCYQHSFPEMDIIGFRFMSVYGPNEEAKGVYANLISQFCWDIKRDKAPVIYGDGMQTRDFTNVKDVVQGLTLAIQCQEKLGVEIFNIGTGQATSVNEIVDTINVVFAKNIQPKYIENPVKEGYIKGQHADIGKISKRLGYKPKITLQDGIQDQVNNINIDKIKGTSSDLFR